MERLARTASTMGRNHVTYLSDVLQTLTHHDPAGEAGRQALHLLCAMWGTPYAERPDPMAALNNVGEWLERRLTEGASRDELAYEVAWLRRLVRYEAGDRSRDRGERGRPQRRFGHTLTARVRAASTQQQEPVASQPAAPTVLSEEEIRQDAGRLSRNRGDGSLLVVLDGGGQVRAHGTHARALHEGLSEPARAKLARKGLVVQVSWRQTGNSREIIALSES